MKGYKKTLVSGEDARDNFSPTTYPKNYHNMEVLMRIGVAPALYGTYEFNEKDEIIAHPHNGKSVNITLESLECDWCMHDYKGCSGKQPKCEQFELDTLDWRLTKDAYVEKLEKSK